MLFLKANPHSPPCHGGDIHFYTFMEKNTKPQVQLSVAQMEIIPGRPDINTAKIIDEIQKAKQRGSDMIVFPEMAVSGYLLGDEWENESLLKDLTDYNADIREATEGITAIWGNVDTDFEKIGEDGRSRKYNSAFIAQNKKWISNGEFEGKTHKTLMPKYREFDDERHFYSMIKIANETRREISELLQPFPLK